MGAGHFLVILTMHSECPIKCSHEKKGMDLEAWMEAWMGWMAGGGGTEIMILTSPGLHSVWKMISAQFCTGDVFGSTFFSSKAVPKHHQITSK